MTEILELTNAGGFSEFSSLFDPEEGRMGVTVTFIAILELLKEQLLEVVQSTNFAPIHVRAVQADDTDEKLANIELEAD